MSTLFESGIRPIVDNYLEVESQKVRDYGEYWSASSAGYCMRKLLMERAGVPFTSQDARKQRVFSAGHIFHQWIQGITKAAGVTVAQELELEDDKLMIRGHIDDLVLLNDKLILYDYKSTHSRSFTYGKGRPISHYHKMQLGTYMYMLQNVRPVDPVKEARVLKISKDDLRMDEQQLLWTPALQKEVFQFWSTLNGYWQVFQKSTKLPKCTCDQYEGGFMARDAYNPYFYKGEACSQAWFDKFIKDNSAKSTEKEQ